MMIMDLVSLSIHDLLILQGAAIDELKTRGVVRTRNNPVGDYAEWLVSSALNLTLAANSAAGYDAVSRSEPVKRYQIKARRVSAVNRSRQLGVIRNLEINDFDYLIAVIFNEDYEVEDAISIPHAVISEYSSFRKHVNGHVLHIRGPLLLDNRVQNIRVALNNFMKSINSSTTLGDQPIAEPHFIQAGDPDDTTAPPPIFVTKDRDERDKRLQAVNFARASVGLEGFTPSEIDEARANAYVAGEITLDEFLGRSIPSA